MPKPDNRADNAAHIQNAIDNTVENLRESEQYLAAHEDEISEGEQAQLKAKNERRRHSIESLADERRDEQPYAKE
ncbi:small acid-soluble spore protein Tlp [Paenibacillus thiaminolyticus]|uniref:small acid-soluble spore protein Tlp n=1 Tax=Paenibacillus thiaminolyticus TaxID=49283 RepID=UPI0025428063|nr:small acid-soluble spore protein Tlp [Paenibacillus thiaminolyticus]WII38028.1 small acid-soluble spore protein Tlp [Paenibacillus thiaminolyticus]